MRIQLETGLWPSRVWSNLCWLWKTTGLDEPSISADRTKVLYPLNQTLLYRTIVTFVIILTLLIFPLERILALSFLFGLLAKSCHFSEHRSTSGNSILRRDYKLYARCPIKAPRHPGGQY